MASRAAPEGNTETADEAADARWRAARRAFMVEWMALKAENSAQWAAFMYFLRRKMPVIGEKFVFLHT